MGDIVDRSAVLLRLGAGDSDTAATTAEEAIADESIALAEGAVIRELKYDPVHRQRTKLYPTVRSAQGARFRWASDWDVQGSHAVRDRVVELGGELLQLTHIPVRSIANLWIDENAKGGKASGAFPSSSLKTEGVDFWAQYDLEDSNGDLACMDGILHNDSGWPHDVSTVKVQYTAGYTKEELTGRDSILDASPIYQAVLTEALRRAKQAFVIWKKSADRGHVAGVIKSERLGDYQYTLGTSSEMALLFGETTGLMPSSTELLSGFVNMGI